MREVGMVFTEREVEAILAGKKRCVRQLMRDQPPAETKFVSHVSGRIFEATSGKTILAPCAVGDVVYVRERFANMADHPDEDDPWWTYKAGTNDQAPGWGLPPGTRWQAPQMMPRHAARVFLRVVAVRGERLQRIGELGAEREGFEHNGAREGLTYAGAGVWVGRGHPSHQRGLPPSARAEFACFWDGRHRAEGRRFRDDPWVFVVGFEREERE